MFGLGLWEIGIIALVIVLFVKPSELPRAARSVGQVVRKIQTASARAKAEMRQLGAALERADQERSGTTPPDDAIHPMQTRPAQTQPAQTQPAETRPAEEDADAGQGYIDQTGSERSSPGTR